ncbi:MAG TPA: phosphopantothenoylcysteine decarboxylase [Acidimicrobiales bacterium]|nr:phosphopantothenoylcysteine decarboxylase [Acidimicrobiales bacterium]
MAALEAALGPDDLAGLDVLITAGGTREPIDPVRFVGNRSSGKQGHALADEAVSRGAKVTLVTTVERAVAHGVEVVMVATAAEMDAAVRERSDRADVVVMAAAVADFRPDTAAVAKLKKEGGPPTVTLVPTDDILGGLLQRRWPGQTLVGFAAETDDVDANATAKLARKPVDLLVVNDVSQPGAGFESDTNEVRIMSPAGSTVTVDQRDKRAVARAVLDAVVAHRATP